MGLYLDDYRARVGTCAGRFSWRGGPRRGDANLATGVCLLLMGLSSMVLSVLLVIGGVEQNPGPVREEENIIQASCTGCSRESSVSYVEVGIIILVET
jgi:hypothetical protein